ncbi:MAG: hypothetical protein MUF71_08420 [Candidatus Kapabacteria bacterium]|nr:hypothetical protein [Candidatus Kapabacteria bacterium]
MEILVYIHIYNIVKNKLICIIGILISFFVFQEVGYAQKILDARTLKTKNLKPAILYWDFGDPEYLTIETIYPSRDSGNFYWNVVHRSPILDDSSGNGFDYYLINEKGLKTIKSQMYHAGFTNYAIDIDKDSAHISIKRPSDSVAYSIKIPDFIAPEGPGSSIFLGSLPLSENYHIQYYELDRWSGAAPKTGQVALTELKVIGVETLEIDGKKVSTYRMNITSKNGRFTEVWALKNEPHYWVKVNHKIDEKRTMKSRVVKMFIFK